MLHSQCHATHYSVCLGHRKYSPQIRVTKEWEDSWECKGCESNQPIEELGD